MSISILGKGWVTNQGCEETAVFDAIMQSAAPRLSEVINPFTSRVHPVALAAKEDLAEAESFRRVRRSSTITLLALTAAQRAIRDSGIEWNEAVARRTALLFVSGDGGVAYTRRFYADIVQNGAAGASPLLFPETVYNAPASHLCAYFGMDGEAITLVGDASTATNAVHCAAEILASGSADYCLVVAAEELDWILCEAYFAWGQTWNRRAGRNTGAPGTFFAEGAGALLLAREGSPLVCRTHPGCAFQNAREGKERLGEIHSELISQTKIVAIAASVNEADTDTVESSCLAENFAGVPIHAIKNTLGEALAASAMQQIIFSALLLQKRVATDEGMLISAFGFNGQAGGVFLTLSQGKG